MDRDLKKVVVAAMDRDMKKISPKNSPSGKVIALSSTEHRSIVRQPVRMRQPVRIKLPMRSSR